MTELERRVRAALSGRAPAGIEPGQSPLRFPQRRQVGVGVPPDGEDPLVQRAGGALVAQTLAEVGEPKVRVEPVPLAFVGNLHPRNDPVVGCRRVGQAAGGEVRGGE